MTVLGAGFTVLAAGFVFVCGANDGGALLAMAARQRSVPPVGVLALLLAAIVCGPALFGLDVARTFTARLVDAADPRGPLIVLGGVSASLLLVLASTWRGLPTSITLAVLGGLAGASAGLGVAPAWATLGLVLLVAAAAPLAGAGLGLLLGMAMRRLPTFHRLPRAVRVAHVAAFTGQSLAYAANDGQKMFAVVGVAVAVIDGAQGMRSPSWPVLTALALTFGLGAVSSLRRMTRGATFGLLAARPWYLVSAEVASAAAVMGSAGAGVPVSMTQSTAAGLVGAGGSQGFRRVRWQFGVPLLVAWLVTLPASLAAGLVAGLAMRAGS